LELNIRIKVPDFYVVGAAKSGTISIWYYLGQHPKIWMTKDIKFKELSYFSLDYGVNDIRDYSKHFDNSNENQIIGEVCHTYLSSPSSARKRV